MAAESPVSLSLLGSPVSEREACETTPHLPTVPTQHAACEWGGTVGEFVCRPHYKKELEEVTH